MRLGHVCLFDVDAILVHVCPFFGDNVQTRMSTPDLVVKIKKLYLNSAKEFKKMEAAQEALTGEGTLSAADWCSDDNRSEVSVR